LVKRERGNLLIEKRKNQNKGRERAGGRLTDCLREKKKTV
jgi:hypothetical protein